MFDESKYCPVTVTQNVLMGKWKLSILWLLHQRTIRFNELQKLLPLISHGVLSQQLKELERDNLISRTVYGEVPPRVEYSLTETGISFIPVMKQIVEWGAGYVKNNTDCDPGICKTNDFPCGKCRNILGTE